MSNPLFTSQFKGSLNEEAIHEIVEQLKIEDTLCVKDVNFESYLKGLRAFRNCENLRHEAVESIRKPIWISSFDLSSSMFTFEN